MNFDARLGKPPRSFLQSWLVRRARIAADHLLSAGAQRERRSGARTGKTYNEIGTAGQRRARLHLMLSWYTVKPIAAKAAATIQKRRMIFVSDQAFSSK